MALVINDRVKENSTTTGTGDITLAGVPSGQGNVTFNSGIGVGNTTYYCIFEQGSSNFEIGLGTLSGSTTLERTTVINNSSGNTSKISFSGTLDVFVTMPAAKTVYLDASGTPVGAASNGFALAMAVAL
jgi:hypothetical protein